LDCTGRLGVAAQRFIAEFTRVNDLVVAADEEKRRARFHFLRTVSATVASTAASMLFASRNRLVLMDADGVPAQQVFQRIRASLK
jgi:hypothetical protein